MGSEQSHQAWRTVRVFISSTFRDMHAERDHLVRFVFPRLREDLLRLRVHLLDIDLRWGVTSDEDAVDACRAVIDECRPFFICLLGGRYGWVPPGADRSITHAEIDYGVLGLTEQLSSHFFYFRDDAATASVPQALAVIYQGSQQDADKLVQLKAGIRARKCKPYIYPARWDHGLERFVGLQDLGERVYEDLTAAIGAQVALTRAAVADEFEQEDAAMHAFAEAKTRNYVIGSRQAMLDRLHRLADSGGLSVLSGESGSGKSALMATFWRKQQAEGHQSRVVAHFVGASSSSTSIRLLLRRLCHALALIAGAKADIPTEYQKLVEMLPSLLNHAARAGRVVLLIDGVNQLRGAHEPRALRWLPRIVPAGVTILITTPSGPALTALRESHAWAKEFKLQPLASSDVAQITDDYLSRYQKRLDAHQRQALFKKKDARWPLYLVAALEELRTLGEYDEITDRIRALPGQTRALFRWILKRLEAESGFRDEHDQPAGPQMVPSYCALLAAGRSGMAQAELIDLVAPGDPFGNIAALQRLLRPYLVERGGLLGFFHAQLEGAVLEEYLPEIARQTDTHRTLAGYFGGRADPGHDRTWLGDSRAMSELPYHLTQGGLWDDVFATLTDFSFLERKATGDDDSNDARDGRDDGSMRHPVASLLDDYAFALKSFPSDGDAASLSVLAPERSPAA